MKRLLLLLTLASCELPSGEVLTREPPPKLPWADCRLALDKATVGDACVGITQCPRAEPPCCMTTLTCNGTQVTSIARDCSACPKCATDADCPANGLCISQHCEPCTPKQCAACPAPFAKLLRNGCDVCECAPVQGCGACSGGQSCSIGAYCHLSCDGPGCCTGFCAAPGCADPNPEGCLTDCGAQSCGVCLASGCQCLGGKWSCTPTCGPDLKAWAGRCKG